MVADTLIRVIIFLFNFLFLPLYTSIKLKVGIRTFKLNVSINSFVSLLLFHKVNLLFLPLYTLIFK